MLKSIVAMQSRTIIYDFYTQINCLCELNLVCRDLRYICRNWGLNPNTLLIHLKNSEFLVNRLSD